MSARDTGGPAFPVAYGAGRIEGMTLRDYFAAKALAGALSSGRVNLDKSNIHSKMSEWAFAQADAMLEARKK